MFTAIFLTCGMLSVGYMEDCIVQYDQRRYYTLEKCEAALQIKDRTLQVQKTINPALTNVEIRDGQCIRWNNVGNKKG